MSSSCLIPTSAGRRAVRTTVSALPQQRKVAPTPISATPSSAAPSRLAAADRATPSSWDGALTSQPPRRPSRMNAPSLLLIRPHPPRDCMVRHSDPPPGDVGHLDKCRSWERMSATRPARFRASQGAEASNGVALARRSGRDVRSHALGLAGNDKQANDQRGVALRVPTPCPVPAFPFSRGGRWGR